MQISPIAEEDLPQLIQLYQQLIPNEYSQERLRDAFLRNQASGNPIVIGAKIGDKLIGTLLAVRAQMLFGACKAFMVVEDVVVDAAYRRKGVGSALMRNVEQHALDNNCSYIMLITDADRHESQQFYKSLGYNTEEYRAFKKHLKLDEMENKLSTEFVICVRNDDYAASLELRKIYRTLSDADANGHKMLRVIDESGEDYLYPRNFFVPVQLPQEAEAIFAEAH
jgi:ribosomal protein S18 acetylase RimI-like enzyme